MKRRILAICTATLLALVGVIGTAGSASATETAPETSYVWWEILPGKAPAISCQTGNVYGTVGGCGDIWNQTVHLVTTDKHSNGGSLKCGIWYQVDAYPTEAVAGLIADNTLTEGEDYSVVQKWKFIYGGTCPLDPPSGNVTFNASHCDGVTPVGNSQAVLTLGEKTTASYTFNDGASTPIAAGTYDVVVGTYVVTLLGEDGTTLVLTVVVPDPKVVLDCLTLVEFVAPTFTAAEGCDTHASITPTEREGVIWTVIFNEETGAYAADASPAVNFKFLAEVQTHWEGNLGAFEPCPEIERCESSATQPTATNLNPLGWELVGAEWVKGGIKFTASNWSDSYAYHTADFNLSEADGLYLDLDIAGTGVWAVILETAAGNIHYEPEPYTLDLWTNAAGILPVSPGGQGGDYAGDLDDIIGDPHITGVYLYFSTGSEEPVTAVLHSGGYHCVAQPFDFAVEPTTPPKLVTTGTDAALPFIGAGSAILLGVMLAVGGAILRRRAHI